MTDPVNELVDMLSIAANEEGATIFDHTPEEIGLHVVENHVAILAALEQAGEPVAWMYESPLGKSVQIGRHPGHEHMASAGWTETPLYAHPPQSRGQAFDGEGEIDRIAAAIHESDPDVGCTWSEWVAYAEAHPHHMQQVEYVRRQAQAVAVLSSTKRGEEG